MISNAFKFSAGALVGLLIVAVAAFAFTVATSTINMRITGETVQTDAASAVVSAGFHLAASSPGAAGGSSGTAVEATTGNPSVNNATTAGNWVYAATVTESDVATWDAAATYKVTVYGDNSVLATLYFKNATADDVSVEGVTVNVDVGSATVLPDSVVVELVKTS